MDCLSPEQMVAYVRGGGPSPRAVEAHVRDCPACAMELLLVRETLGELRAKAIRPGTDRLRTVPRKRSITWVPWAVAASLLIAALIFAVAFHPTPPPGIVKTPDPVRPKPAPLPPPPIDVPKLPDPAPKLPDPVPMPEPLKPQPEIPPAPKPEKAPEPVKPPLPVPPAPEPEPKKPAPTVVEKAVIARVTHSMGSTMSPIGRTFRAGETVTTTRQEYLEVALEGYGRLYFRENSQADLGAAGDVTLHEGEMLAKMDPGRRLSSLKLAVVQVEPLAPVFNVLATKTSAEISILDGRIAVGTASAKGPATMIVKSGKAPEIRALDPGFASWIPDKLASKKFTGWFEAEEFPNLQGFRVSPSEGSSGGKAVVQIADQGGVATKLALPFKGRHVVWLRARQYEAKPAVIGIHLNGQATADVKLEWDGKPWRWVGPLIVSTDRLDLGITALSRWPLKEGGEAARSFPVVIDAVVVSSDLKYIPPEKPPERLTEEGRGQELAFDDPAGK